jgi:hypothetical protein
VIAHERAPDHKSPSQEQLATSQKLRLTGVSLPSERKSALAGNPVCTQVPMLGFMVELPDAASQGMLCRDLSTPPQSQSSFVVGRDDSG